MPITATGNLAIRLLGVKTLLAACAQVRTECGVATATLALPFIRLLEVDEGTDDDFPRFIVAPAGDFARRRNGPGTWEDSGAIRIVMELTKNDSAANFQEEYLDVLNRVSTIMDQAEVLAGQGDSGNGLSYVNMTGWLPPVIERCEPQHENGVYYWVAFVDITVEG